MTEFKPDFTSIDYFINNSFIGKPAKSGFPGFLKTSRFGARFELPSVFGNESSTNVQEYMTNNIASFEIPGFNLSEEETPLRHSLIRRSVGTITAVFYEDPIISIENAIFKWMNTIITHNSDTDNFQRQYLDDIKGTIRLFPLLLDGDVAPRNHLFSDVFPTSVSPVTFDISDENSVGRVTVTLKYRYHIIEENFGIVGGFTPESTFSTPGGLLGRI